MAVKHVRFEDHCGPFKAVVESTRQGVRVRFDGWGQEPFAAVADKEVRIIYWVAGRKEMDFTAEVATAEEVSLRLAGRPVIRGTRIVIELGGHAAQGVANVPVGGRAN
jgi:hypothetical protein